MPESQTVVRAHRDAEEGKSPSTQAGEFVREEIEHIRQGKHGARSTKQVIAIGLSKARRAGVKLPPPNSKKTSATTRRKAKQDLASARKRKNPSRRRSRATSAALKREHKQAASPKSLSYTRAQRLRRVARKNTQKLLIKQSVHEENNRVMRAWSFVALQIIHDARSNQLGNAREFEIGINGIEDGLLKKLAEKP